jgi:putative transposase
LGELKKLGITVARGTVANILREKGVPTGPARGESAWDEFLRRHAKTLWACDLVHVRTLTLRGFRRAYALVFIHPHSRRVVVSPSTLSPNAAWVTEQARAFAKTAGATSSSGGIDRPRILLRDIDTKFAAGFVEAMRGAGITTKRLPHRAPNLNAYAERFIQTLRTECLDRSIVCGTGHLDHLTSEFVEHYLHERPHMGLGLRCPAGPKVRFAGQAPVRPSEIVCQQRLGGVLRHYHRKKAA